MLFRSTTTKEGEIFFVDDKEIGLRELAMNVAIPTDPGQRTVKGYNCWFRRLMSSFHCFVLFCFLETLLPPFLFFLFFSAHWLCIEGSPPVGSHAQQNAGKDK